MRITVILFMVIVMFVMMLNDDKIIENHYYIPSKEEIINLGPPNYQLYDYIEIYTDEFGIPIDKALKCAREETLYRGRYDFKYKPFIDKWRVSTANAYGPLQVQHPTATDYIDSVTVEELMYDIRINSLAGIMYMHDLYYNYKLTKNDWEKVYSVYNQGWTGANNINQYAKNITR